MARSEVCNARCAGHQLASISATDHEVDLRLDSRMRGLRGGARIVRLDEAAGAGSDGVGLGRVGERLSELRLTVPARQRMVLVMR